MTKLFGFIIALLLSCSVFANDGGETSVKKASEVWAAAISARNAQTIASLYDRKAFLYATFKNVLDTPAEIKDYFIKLTKHDDLTVKFNRVHIRTYGDVAINSGTYTFSYKENDKTIKVPGRYTFVYLKTKSGWMIIDHHSSIMPE
jgi:hypothetical protein